MRQVTGAAMTSEAYIQYELKSELRNEFINGQLFEMPGEKDINNRIALMIAVILLRQLQLKDGYQVYNHDVKVGIPGGRKFYYPDVFVTAEPRMPENQYIKYSPQIIVEVVSESSQTHDYVNKYLDYIQFPTLQYYLIAEPETTLVTVYERSGEEWVARKYTRLEDDILIPGLDIQLPMAEIYC